MNFYDIGGNGAGRSLENMKIFMDEVGNNWVPIHFNPQKVMDSEKASVPMPFVDGSIIKAYYPFIHAGSLTLNQAVDLAGALEVKSVRQKNISSLQDLRSDINAYINDPYGKTRGEKIFQETIFVPSRPTEFVYHKIFSLLLKQGQLLSNNDIIDFFHAVVALSHVDMVVLDGGWADRARQISIPDGRVECYSANKKGLDRFQEDFGNFFKRISRHIP